MPTYGDETEKGFYLRDGGYYFAINDKIDLKLIGEIYTKGSWGLSATSNYNKRYRFSGTFYVSYQNSIHGEKNMPDYAKETSFKVQWSHRQDPKANPFTTLSASVNFATSGYEPNNLSSMYNPQARTQTTRTSSVSWTTTFSSLGMTLNGSTRLNQNMRDSIIEMTLPDLTLNVTRFYPFKRKKRVGPERWYEKINMSYTGHMKNEISTKENKLLHSSLTKDWKNGLDHSIPISATFTAFNYINMSPSINLRDVMTFRKIDRSWDAKNQREVRDTVSGFYNLYSWNLSVSASTKLYGFWVPSRKIFGDKIQAIRHVLTPEIGFTYAPDFGSAKYGYWKQYVKTDDQGNESYVDYSPYEGAAYSVPGKGKTGMLTFGLGNNLEMKVRSDDDSTGFKKISLIDEFKLSTYYNFAADKRPMGDVSATLRLKLSKSYSINLSTSFASYQYELDSLGNIVESDHTTYWQKGKFGRFQGLTQSFNFNLDNEKVLNFFKFLRGEKVDKKKDNKKKNPEDDWSTETNIDKEMEEAKHAAKGKKGDKAETDEDGYMTIKLPWSLRLSYSVSVREDKRKEKFNYDKMRYSYKFTHTLNASGNIRISDGWDISYSSGYDFENKKISMTTVGLSRDLHCFNMSCNVVLAPYTSYNFSFRCNASTLTDALKYDKRSSGSSAVQWY